MSEFDFPVPPPSPSPPSAPRSGCRRGCLVALAAVGAGTVLVVILLGLAFGSLASSIESLAAGAATPPDRGVDEYPQLGETWSAGHGDVKVVRIPLRGMILLGEGGGWRPGSADNADAALRSIRRATADPEVKGLLLEIDSGGGGITASDILYDALLRFKQAEPDRVIVAHMGDIAASGAYYIALAADHILAHPTTITGSIGVILSSVNVRDLTERLGIRDASVKSGDNKDLLNPMGVLTEEQKALLQGIVDRMHARFVGLVAERRHLDPAIVATLADGRIFLAQQAQEADLIDGQGYAADAQKSVTSLLGVEDARFVRYEQSMSLRDLLRSPGFWGAALSEAWPQAASGHSLPQLR